MTEILLGVVMFTGVVLVLVGIIEIAKWNLVPKGNVSILINEQKTITVPVGGKLLGALASNDIFVSSACGGGGTCAQCKVKVLEGGGDILPPRTQSHFQPRSQSGGTAFLSGRRQAGPENRGPSGSF